MPYRQLIPGILRPQPVSIPHRWVSNLNGVCDIPGTYAPQQYRYVVMLFSSVLETKDQTPPTRRRRRRRNTPPSIFILYVFATSARFPTTYCCLLRALEQTRLKKGRLFETRPPAGMPDARSRNTARLSGRSAYWQTHSTSMEGPSPASTRGKRFTQGGNITIYYWRSFRVLQITIKTIDCRS